METPLRPVRRAGRWLRRLAGVTLLSGGIVGCATFGDATVQNDKQQGTAIAQCPSIQTRSPSSTPMWYRPRAVAR